MRQMDSRNRIQPRRQFRMSELSLFKKSFRYALTEIQLNENGLEINPEWCSCQWHDHVLSVGRTFQQFLIPFL